MELVFELLQEYFRELSKNKSNGIITRLKIFLITIRSHKGDKKGWTLVTKFH